MIKFNVPDTGKGSGLKIIYSAIPRAKAKRIMPASSGRYFHLGDSKPTSTPCSPCSHMQVNIAMNRGMDTSMKLKIQLN